MLDKYFYDIWLWLYNFSNFIEDKGKFEYTKLVDDLTIYKICY